MEKIYDSIIIGAGPAGLTAAIYGERACLELLVLEKGFLQGGQISETREVDNYPGLPGIPGGDLAEAFAAHAEKMGVRSERAVISGIEREEDGTFSVRTRKETFRTRTILIASGAEHRHLDIPGEDDFCGMGVSYCASCDGAFYRDKTVAVIGGGNTAVEDALYLARGCSKVYVIHRRDDFRCAPVLKKAVMERENVEILWNRTAAEILGDEEVDGIRLRSVITGEETELAVDGVFIAVGMVPNTGFLRGLVELDGAGYVIAGEDGATRTEGVFAAGDVRTKKLRQVVTAVSDGANAMNSIEEYLRSRI